MAQNKYKRSSIQKYTLHIVASITLLLLCRPVYTAEINITIQDKGQRPVHDTVIELVGKNLNAVSTKNVEISQQSEEFEPVLSLIPQGSSVLFRNQDPFKHHVYSVSPGNEFDLPLFSDEPVKPISFDTPGVVKMGCNIHDWMLAFAYVSESQHVALTDGSGSARFSDLEAGDYELRVWNPRLRNNRNIIVHALTVQEDQSLEHLVEVSFRKNIRKPPRKQNSSAFSAEGYQGNH